jgi:molybdate transport system substrate-binding protein
MNFGFTRWFMAMLAAASISHPVIADEVRVAVAANFTGAARELAPLFEKQTGHSVKLSFGSTGKLYTQIENGAPFDVFMAADTKRPERAVQKGLAVPDSQFIYARGRLVLWSTSPCLFEDGETYLRGATFDHLAIANPKTAPYGLAAQQVMQKLGVWDEIDMQDKLVRGDSIAQAFQFVATENADIGFVAMSQVKAWKGDAGSSWEVPQELYEPIDQGAVLLKRGAENPAARAFMAFLSSAEASSVIEGFGYGVKSTP